ncbi:ABC transporter permease subunit [Streptomyces tagetis]|uniref:ABC transporter permease subunit n=1 Tax=Streptomyces tagetis TaxID=2820809 RepID=A0A941AZT6_9ACTN|nr:ABC transporter permease subunit [Streptomyces sp. RG38]MBQ0826540.1 ABC transporter permease subunit [Streptomyces sp. RG38]
MTTATVTRGSPDTARPVRGAEGRNRTAAALLLLPALIALLLLFVLPMISVAVRSVTEPQAGLGNYIGLFTDGYTLRVLGRTLLVALIVAVAGLLVAYPYAYAMTLAGPVGRALLVTVVLVPFWTSMLARNYAWLVLLQDGGLIQRFSRTVGLGDEPLFGTTAGVALSMTQVLLPFLVLPLYSSMQQIDRRLLDAGQSLGASRLRSFRKIYLPLSMPGVMAGTSLVFVLALGFYVTPALLGSPQNAMIAQIINVRARDRLDFGGAGAMGIFVLVVTLLVMGLAQRIAKGRTLSSVPGVAAPARPAGPGGGGSGPWLRLYTVLVGFLLTAPTLVVIPMSLSAGTTFRFPPEEWSTRWYDNLAHSPAWTESIGNSLQVALVSALAATVLGTAAAMGLQRLGPRSRGVLFGLLLSPLIVPNILVALVIFAAFLRLGLNGTLGGIMLAHTALALPYVVIAVFARLQGMDPRLATAASGLGARPWSVFRRVTLPQALPGVLSGAVLAFVTSLDEVVVALFLQAPGVFTLPVQMFNSVTIQIDPTISAASSVMVILVSVPILLAQLVGARRGKAGTR